MERGEPARLIPVIADSRKEQRVASVFLSTISAVPELAAPLLTAINVRLGKRSKIDTYVEVVVRSNSNAQDRPDGLVVINSGKTTWTALIEAKIGPASLDEDQVQRYLQIARDNKIDAVITVSNQFVSRATHSPVNVPRVLFRKVDLFHWSWKFALTEAMLLEAKRTVADPAKAFILREFIRFLSHDSVGVGGFQQMPSEWKDLLSQVMTGGVARKASNEVESVVTAWHQESRDLALRFSQHLAAPIEIKLSRAHARDADARFKDDCSQLASTQMLQSELIIPNAASTLSIVADLRTKTIRVGMEVDAPQDRQRATARVNWLLKQVRHVNMDNVFIRIAWPNKATDTVTSLTELRETPAQVLSANSQPPRRFGLFLVSDNARRFAGRKTFIEDLESLVPKFYDEIGQHLEKWVARPPTPIPVPNDPAQHHSPAQDKDAPTEIPTEPSLAPTSIVSLLNNSGHTVVPPKDTESESSD